MKLNKKFLILLSLSIIFTFKISCGQKTTTEEFLSENSIEDASLLKTFNEIKENINADEIKFGKQAKGAISSKSKLMLVQGEKSFPTPIAFYKLSDVSKPLNIEFYSLGDMAGFKKVIMFPIIFIYNENGELVKETSLNSYESRAADMKYPYHIFASWSVNITTPGTYYLVVASDNSSADEVGLWASTGYENSMNVNKAGKGWLPNYSVKRSPYGKFKITVN